MLVAISSHKKAPADLIGLLLECHGRIRSFVSLAREAGTSVDAPTDQVVDACTRAERYFREALPLHVADEEESILPRIRGRSPDIDRALKAMHDQHARHEPKLTALLAASSAVRETPGHRGLRTLLARAATDLELEFREHLALEETVVFPAVRKLLSAATQAEIIEELRMRRAR